MSKPLVIIAEAKHSLGRSIAYAVPPNDSGIIGMHSLGNGRPFTEQEFKKFIASPMFKEAERFAAEEAKKPAFEVAE